MAQGLIEKYKRRTLLAALLLVFRGRVKYAAMLLAVAAVSLTFVFSGETFRGMLEIPPIAAMFRALHLGGLAADLSRGPEYSGELVKSAMDKAAADSARASYLNGLKGGALPCPGCAAGDSLAMVKGNADLDGAGNKRAGPGEVTGVVGDEAKARGEGADAVRLDGTLGAGVPGGDAGLYGGSMGLSLAGLYSGGAKRAAAGDRKEGMFANALNQAGGMIPIPGRAAQVPSARMGRASGFSWRNVNYRTRSYALDKKAGAKRPIFQLAETYSVGNIARESKDSASEYQAAYIGSTYDGNDVNLDIIQTEAGQAVFPKTGFPIVSGGGGSQQAADCAKAQAVNGPKMSEDSAKMDQLSNQLARESAPACYDDIGSWNQRVAEQGELCKDYNANQAELSRACQTSNTAMDCSKYFNDTASGGMVISKCEKPHGPLWMFMYLLMIVIAVIIAIALIFISLIAFMAALFAYFIWEALQGLGPGMGGGQALYKDKSVSETDATPGLEKKK